MTLKKFVFWASPRKTVKALCEISCFYDVELLCNAMNQPRKTFL